MAGANNAIEQRAREIEKYISSPGNLALLLTDGASKNIKDSHVVMQHEHKAVQFMIDRLANETSREYVSSTYGRIDALTQRSLKPLSLKIAWWLSQTDRRSNDYLRKEFYVIFPSPIGNALSKGGREYESRVAKLVLGRDKGSDVGFYVKTMFPDANHAIELDQKRDPKKDPVPLFRETGFQIVPESELLSETSTASRSLRMYRNLKMMQNELVCTKDKNDTQVKIKYADIGYGKGKLVVSAMTSKLAGYIEIDDEARVRTYTKDPNQFQTRAKEQPIKLQTLASKIPELGPYVQEISKYASIIRASSKSYDSAEVMSTEEAEGKIRYTDASKRAESLEDIADKSKVRLYFPDKMIFSDGYLVRDTKTNNAVFLEAATGYRTILHPEKMTTDLSALEENEAAGSYTLDVYEKEILIKERRAKYINHSNDSIVIEKDTMKTNDRVDGRNQSEHDDR